ncbi:MAG: transposase [Ktedonobacteraceae bacterium]|nr:transposase [Ktedonobacteraceae bacterium]
MHQHNTMVTQRKWYDSGHASLCILGKYLRQIGFFESLERRVHIKQKVLKYTPIQKLEMLFVGLLAGIKAVSHTATTVRVDRALTAAFGLPGCAEQSVLADTLDAATDADVADLAAAIAELFGPYSQARQHDFDQEFLVLDVDLSPLPASKHAEGSERGYLGRSRSKTGRKLVRVRAATTGEIVWETVISARTVESLPLLQEAIQAAEHLLGIEGDSQEAQRKRACTEIRLDSSWGSEAMITWLLCRGYHVTGKFKSNGRVRKLVEGITTWSATSSPGREVAVIPEPVEFVRPLAQYGVRTPSKEQPSGYYHAVVFTSRTELSMQEVVDHYDGRAGMEADLKADKQGLGLATIRKHRLPAQKIVILLMQLAHNVLLWARRWLSKAVPRLNEYGIVRLISQVWAIPGRLKLIDQQVQRIRLQPTHPRTRDVWRGFHPLLLTLHLEELVR